MAISVRGPQADNYRIIKRGSSIYDSGGAYGGVLYVWKRGYGTSNASSYNGNTGVYSLLMRYAVWTGK